jgi:hypothetical protein
MSMTLTAMATEVAKSIGGHNTAVTVDLATTAVKASIADWNAAKNWNFLLKDTAAGFSVSGCTATATSSSVTAPDTGAFDAVNVGVTVTISSGTATLTAGTTVSSITRASGGTIASITLSNAFGGTTNTNATLTFTGDVPIIASTNEYNLPTDFQSPYAARLLTNPRLLVYIQYREWNKKIVNQSTTGSVDAYTVYNPISPQTQNFSTYRLRVFSTPSAADTLHLQYFRRMDVDATTVDVPDEYLYMLIDYAIWRFIRLKDTEDTRLPHLYEVAQASLAKAMNDDEELSDDEELRLISQLEAWTGNRPLWGNGQFNPVDY